MFIQVGSHSRQALKPGRRPPRVPLYLLFVVFVFACPWQVANQGSSECTEKFSDDGTLIGLYLLIAGIILVVFTLIGVFLQKHCGDSVRRASVHNRELTHGETLQPPGCN